MFSTLYVHVLVCSLVLWVQHFIYLFHIMKYNCTSHNPALMPNPSLKVSPNGVAH
jgi:hypothetical protein